MNLGQIAIVLLALILLSTVLLSIFNNMMTQTDFAARNIYLTQSLKIVDRVFQEYESMLLGKKIVFDDLTLPAEGRNFVINDVEGATYDVTVTSRNTDRRGVPSILPGPTDFKRLDIRIRVNTGHSEIFIGDDSSAFSKVFGRFYEDAP